MITSRNNFHTNTLQDLQRTTASLPAKIAECLNQINVTGKKQKWKEITASHEEIEYTIEIDSHVGRISDNDM